MSLHEFRCKNCGKLLFKMEYGVIETKCYRCGAYNIIDSQPKKIKGQPFQSEKLDYKTLENIEK